METMYQYEGTVREPTWRDVSFPPVVISGSIAVGIPEFPGDFVIATAFIRRSNGRFVRDDGLPVENSNGFTIE
jgi:hypothetical protein